MSQYISRLLAGPIAALALSAPAIAAPMLIYVSSKGKDGPGCGTIASPCRNLQAAQDAVAPGGYIDILDPGEFAPVGLNKSVTIVNESAGAALVRSEPSFSAAVWANPGLSGVARLRGLTIEGRGQSTAGVSLIEAKRLELTDCVMRNADYGVIMVHRTARPSFAFVNATVTNNVGFGVYGAVSGGYAKGLRLINNFRGGMLLEQSAPEFIGEVVIEDSFAANDPGKSEAASFGFKLHSDIFMALRRTAVVGFPFGVEANDSILRLTGSTLTGNATVARKNNPSFPMIESSGDNVVRGNQDDALGVFTPAALH